MTTITIDRAVVERALEAWGTTVLEKHRDGMMQERMESLRAALEQQADPVAWRFIGLAGCKRYLTQRQYEAQTPGMQQWYAPLDAAHDECCDQKNALEHHSLRPLEPTQAMIDAGAQRLVNWEDECEWPRSWDTLEVAAARNEAERVWRAMWLAAEVKSNER